MDEYKETLRRWIKDAAWDEDYDREHDNPAGEMYWQGARIAYETALVELESMED